MNPLDWNFFQWTLVLGTLVIAAATVLGAIFWHAHMKIFRVRFRTRNGKAGILKIEAANVGEAVDILRAAYPGAKITRAEAL